MALIKAPPTRRVRRTNDTRAPPNRIQPTKVHPANVKNYPHLLEKHPELADYHGPSSEFGRK
eukprot:Pgem_evm1s18546